MNVKREACHVKIFDGFDDPKQNWCKLPHSFIEGLPLIETVSEFKVIMYILRHTWGYHDDEKRITLDEFAHGRKRKDGSRIDEGTGLTIPSIRDGLKRAIAHGFIEHRQDSKDKARVKNFYTLKMRGEKLLHPECKSFSPCMQDSLPRTEKETLETNPKKETGETLSLREQAERGEMAPETELALLAEYGRQGKAGVADPSQDEAQWFKYREEIINVFIENGGDLGKRMNQQQPRRDAIMGFAARQEDFDMERWRSSVHTAVTLGGVNGANLSCIFETYLDGGDYQEMWKKRKNGGKANAAHRRSSRAVRGGNAAAARGKSKLTQEQREKLGIDQ